MLMLILDTELFVHLSCCHMMKSHRRDRFRVRDRQGCGRGLDVSVWRQSRDVPMSSLGLVSTTVASVSVSSCEADVSVSSVSPPFTCRVQDQFLGKL